MTMLLAYHGSEAIRDEYLSRVRAHREADELVQNYGYWKDGKGCAVGCTIHGDNHAAYETELGIPVALAHLEDGIFEGLPVEGARTWPERFLSAITPGADLSRVVPHVLMRIVARRREALADLAIAEALRTTVGEAMDAVLVVLRQWTATGVLDTDTAESAARAAEAAWAAEAAVSEARAAKSAESAASAAQSAWAAKSAESAAAAAAWAAAESAAEYAWIAGVVLEELAAAPVHAGTEGGGT